MIWGPVAAVTEVMDESEEHRESDQWDPGWPGAAGERGESAVCRHPVIRISHYTTAVQWQWQLQSKLVSSQCVTMNGDCS